MNLKQQYPEMANFLGSEFPDADLEGFSDEEVAKRYASRVSPGLRSKVVEEGKALLAQTFFPWEEVGDEANRAFLDLKDARQWLEMILRIIEPT